MSLKGISILLLISYSLQNTFCIIVVSPLLLISFHSSRNFLYRYANRYQNTSRSTSGQISGHSDHSGKFWQILAEMQILAGTGFGLLLKKKKKKKVKVQTTPFWSLLKYLISNLFFSWILSLSNLSLTAVVLSVESLCCALSCSSVS